MSSKPSILHIPIKREYFDAILSGEKTEEYRDFSPFWCSRLLNKNDAGEYESARLYDIVRFRNGYEPDSPVMDVEYVRIFVDEYADAPSNATDEERLYFSIVLGKVLSTSNV